VESIHIGNKTHCLLSELISNDCIQDNKTQNLQDMRSIFQLVVSTHINRFCHAIHISQSILFQCIEFLINVVFLLILSVYSSCRTFLIALNVVRWTLTSQNPCPGTLRLKFYFYTHPIQLMRTFYYLSSN